MTDDQQKNKSLMRSIGEFFGHIIKGVRTDVSHGRQRRTISREVTEEKHGSVTLRETRIREIEIENNE